MGEVRRKPRHIESRIQEACVTWFKLTYRNTIAPLLFAVPNGGYRNAREAQAMKREGVTAGVADLVLLIPSQDKRHHALCIEMKAGKGAQTKLQKEWQTVAERFGVRYVVCRSFDDFKKEVTEYLNADEQQ